MDKNSEIIESFESVLKQQSGIKPLPIYNDKNKQNLDRATSNLNICAQSVITKVARQIKAMQGSEFVKSGSKTVLNMNKYKKSSFLPLNMLQEQRVPPHPPDPQKFDTQLFTATQLISVVEDAEAMDVDSGMTQEFETTFFQGQDDSNGHEEKNICPQKDNHFPILDISLKEPDPNVIVTSQVKDEDVNFYGNPVKYNQNSETAIKIDTKVDTKRVLNECIEEKDLFDDFRHDPAKQESDIVSFDPNNDIQEPLSPVFNVKPKHSISDFERDETSLVYNLEKFEKFEEIAMPVIEQTPDKEEAIILINSQIINKELFFHTNIEDMGPLSPVIEINNLPFKIKRETLPRSIKDLVCYDAKDNKIEEGKCLDDKEDSKSKGSNESSKSLLKDEILFSSDEEDEYQHLSYKDLPFTCALETSFYEHSATLDKTMYVGFQTASDRSIQIGTDSYCKAKSWLDSIEKDLKNEASLTELVKMCASNTVNDEIVETDEKTNMSKTILVGNQEDDVKVTENVNSDIRIPGQMVDTESVISVHLPTYVNSEKKNKKPEKTDKLLTSLPVCNNSFIGFKTASNKTIKLSETAIEKSKKVFQNIDLVGNCEFGVKAPSNPDNDQVNSQKVTENVKISENNAKHILLEEQSIDDAIIREFQDDLIHAEFEDILENIEERDVTLSGNAMKINDKSILEDIKTNVTKNICIPDAALAKSKKLLQPDIKTNVTEAKENEFKYIGFRTVSNKNICISAEALAKGKKVLHDLEKKRRIFNKDDIEEPFYGFEQNDEYFALIEETLEKSQILFEKLTQEKCNIFKSDVSNNKHCIEAVIEQNLKASQTRFATTKLTNEGKSCVGFKTANNEEIKISEAALAKSRKIFQDLDNTKAIGIHLEIPDTNTEFKDFKNASNEEVKIPEATLARSTKLFEDIGDDKANVPISDVKTQFKGFKTASNKKVTISESYNTRKIFQGIDDDKNSHMNVGIPEAVTHLKGFKTASNKEVKISAAALARSRKLFQDIDDDKVSDINVPISNAKTQFKGFKTASNKEVTISETALAKSRKMFQDIDDDKASAWDVEIPEAITILFKGFKTASNKKVKISETDLARSRKILQDIDDDKASDINLPISNSKTQFEGFKTASNKEVTISETALAKSRKIFQGIDDDKNSHMNVGTPEAVTHLKGFKTASNKEVKISAAALARSRKLFQDIDDDKVSDIDVPISNAKTQFKGFKTASNKEVTISETALAKSRKIFQDIDDDKNSHINVGIPEAVTHFKGFKTASNKDVTISETALAKSRKIFQEVPQLESSNTNTENTTKLTFKGFQTASNKEVKVSAESMAKSKKLFQEINNDLPNKVDYVNRNKSPTNGSDTDFMLKSSQTESSNELKISANELPRSRQIFQNLSKDLSSITTKCDIGETNTRRSVTNSILKGFQTASNKDVRISAEALAKSKELLQDLNTNDDKYVETNTIADTSCKGFQTANNKNVKIIISEKEIMSRKMFENLVMGSKAASTDSDNSQSSIACHSRLNDISIKSAKNRTDVSEDDLVKSKNLLNKPDTMHQSKMKLQLTGGQKCNENFEDVDTQLLNNFEVSMSESTPRTSKRSGSPILSCPKAKKRKIFQIPYSQKSPKRNTEPNFKPPSVVQKPENIYNFSLSYKKTKEYSLKDLKQIEDASMNVQENVDPYVKQFDFDNLLQFEFHKNRNDINNSVLTMPELKNIFLNSVSKKLIPEGWLDIQLKLILWKLLSYEIKFPKTMSLTCTAKNVMEQLKYRYDKELYNAERPALRKIFERDDTSAKTLILCVVAVCDINDTSESTPELLLTDGWYIIKTVIDKMLAKLVSTGKITVGTKLVTNGAELVGSEQAVSPWEDTSSIRLKIFGNSTRRARWDARLGYHSNGAILSRLSNVALDGGKVSKLRVFVTRVYPSLYVDKFEDGSTVTRSERLEYLYQVKYENERQAQLEKIYEEVEREVMDQDFEDSEGTENTGERKCLDSGSQIAKVVKNSRYPNEFRSHLTSTQTNLLEDFNTKEPERLLQTIQVKVQDKMAALGLNFNRNVVMLFKIRVAAVDGRNDSVKITRAMLSIWRPNEAVVEMIKEGTWLEILNVVPTALRYSELQLSAGRQSIFIQSKYKENEKMKPYTESLKRTCYPIKDLVKSPAMTTDYNEIDTVGIVFEIDPDIASFNLNKHQFQNVYLADGDKNIISMNFWGGLKKFGFENVVEAGQIIACTNLQKRAGNSRKSIPQYRVTEFSYFTKTPKGDIARKIIEELRQNLSKIDKRSFYQGCISLKSNYSAKLQISDNVTPYRFPHVDINATKNSIFIDSPLMQNHNKNDEYLNLTGLDFDSTFKQTDSEELSPRTLLRKRQVKERIAKLKRYGEPPPLSPMQIFNKSKKAANAYKSPLMSKSDVSPSVAICEQNLPIEEEYAKVSDVNIQHSPVIGLNRTYVKRSNPVVLNFSKNENSVSEVDEFAEEFDCSPPLSLD